MFKVLAVVILVACSHPAAPAKPADCPVSPVAKPEPVTRPTAPAKLDDATTIARAEAFMRAIDSEDPKAIEAVTTPGFVWFMYGRTYSRQLLTEPRDVKSPIPVRTCKDPRINASAAGATYTAECTEKFAAHDDVPAYEYTSFSNVVLVPDGADWKAAFWTLQTASLDLERDMWNDLFQRGFGFKKTINQHLVDSVKGRKPGKALDIAMGQGRNVLGLAALGWKVTGLDISEAGIKIAKEAAAKKKLTFEAVVQDMDKYDFGKDKWDLVTLIYAGDDSKLIERIKPSIKKGGLFVVEFFSKDATAGTGIGGFAPGALAKQFDGWLIITDVVVDDIADWGLHKTGVARFTAQKK